MRRTGRKILWEEEGQRRKFVLEIRRTPEQTNLVGRVVENSNGERERERRNVDEGVAKGWLQ